MLNKELTLVQKSAIKVLFGINNAYGIGISGSNGSYCVDIDYDKPSGHTGVWTIKGYSGKQSAVAFNNTVTQADIGVAPDWVKAIQPVEVTDDD